MRAIVVYAIKFESGQTYVGISDDLDRRFEEHRRRQSPSTKRFFGEFRLIYPKSFPDYLSTRQHEKFLKSGAGRQLLDASVRT